MKMQDLKKASEFKPGKVVLSLNGVRNYAPLSGSFILGLGHLATIGTSPLLGATIVQQKDTYAKAPCKDTNKIASFFLAYSRNN